MAVAARLIRADGAGHLLCSSSRPGRAVPSDLFRMRVEGKEEREGRRDER